MCVCAANLDCKLILEFIVIGLDLDYIFKLGRTRIFVVLLCYVG